MKLVIHNRSSLKLKNRTKKKVQIRKKIFGTAERPRLSVFRSGKHMYAQLIDDATGVTLASTSSLKMQDKSSGVDKAKKVGVQIASVAKEKGIEKVVFDRNGFIFHGKIKSLADGAREAGLNF